MPQADVTSAAHPVVDVPRDNNRSTVDKIEHLGLLAAHGAWEYIKKDSSGVAIKAAEGLAIGVAVATAPAWLGVAAGVAGVGLLGKEIYDKGKTLLPTIEIIWHDDSSAADRKKAEEVFSTEVGTILVDSTAMIGVGFGAGKLASGIRGLTRGLSHEQMDKMTLDATTRMRELIPQYKAEIEAFHAHIDYKRPGGAYVGMDPRGLIRGLDALNPDVGRHFNGHGMAKGSWLDQLKGLQELLTKGQANDRRPLYEMPLRGMEEYAGAFGATRPFDTGTFILLSEAGARGGIRENGIKYVLVNDHFYGAIADLQAAFPKVTFIRADEIATRLPQILREKRPDLYASAMAQTAARVKADAHKPKTETFTSWFNSPRRFEPAPPVKVAPPLEPVASMPKELPPLTGDPAIDW
ncbi:MAG: hypothetical protein JSS83_27555 [Cyanobacteria bacterium SZAS LIN-3]|nr:hypothetical protein [Cyanobacteria bacterium SZAS LIN-3]